MNINFAKVLNAKAKQTPLNIYSGIFEDAKTKNTLDGYSDYVSKLSKESDSVIKENVESLTENYITARYLKYFVSHESSLTLGDLTSINDIIKEKIKTCEDKHLEEYLKSTSDRISDVIEDKSTTKWVNANVKYKLACERFNSSCLFESNIGDNLELIGYSINITPDAINEYSKILSSIEMEEYSKIEQSFPKIIAKNTDIILGLDVVLSGRTASLFTSMPTVLVNRLVIDGSIKQRRAFKPILIKQVSIVRASIKTADARQYPILKGYLDSLYKAIETLDANMKNAPIKEHLADMQPDIIMYEDGVLEDPVSELEELIADIIFDDDEISKESLIKFGTLAKEIRSNFIVNESSQICRVKPNNVPGLAAVNSLEYDSDPFADCVFNHASKIKNLCSIEFKYSMICDKQFKARLIDCINAYTLTEKYDGVYINLLECAVEMLCILYSCDFFECDTAEELRVVLSNNLSRVNKCIKDDTYLNNRFVIIKNKIENVLNTKRNCLENCTEFRCSNKDITDIGEIDNLISDILDNYSNYLNDACIESFTKLHNEINSFDYVSEAGIVTKAVRKGAYKASSIANKASAKVATAAADAKRTKVAIQKGTDPYVNMANKLVNDAKNLDRNERRERIITGQFKLKLFKTLKKLIGMLLVAGTATAMYGNIVGAAVAIIGILAGAAVDKKLDDKARREIIHELETELAVVNEKLEDSRGDENKANKYQLIRIKKKLESDLDRVRYFMKAKDTKIDS